MNKLRFSIFLKAITWLAGSLAAVALIASAFLAILLADAGAYDQTPVASEMLYYRTDQARQYIGRQASEFFDILFASKVFIPAREVAGRTVDADWKLEMEQAVQLLADGQNETFSWTVLDESDQEIWSNQEDRPVLASLDFHMSASLYTLYRAAYGVEPDSAAYESMVPLDQSYTVRTDLYLLEPADPQQLSWYYGFYRLGLNREIIAFAPFAFLLLTVLAAWYLFWSAGYRKGTEGIHLTWYDRIPLEILAIIYFLMLGLTISSLNGLDYTYRQFSLFQADYLDIAGLSLLIWIMGLLSLRFLVSLAIRVKAGQFWRRTLVWQVLHVIGKILAKLPLLWKGLLSMAGVVLVEFLFIAGFSGRVPNPMLLLLIFFFFHGSLICLASLIIIQLDKLREAGQHLAEGDLDYKVDEAQLFGTLRRHGTHLNSIRQGISLAVDERMKSERFKTELITNVSHDIKTPLTSIINYVDLLKGCPLEDPTAREYIDVIDRQSARLKKLAEDIVSASKAATGMVPVQSEQTDLVELLAQTAEEYTDRLTQARLTLVSRLPSEPCTIITDGKLLWRVLDNLFQNVFKYGQPDTRVYLDLQKSAGTVTITLRNISREPLNINSEELFERFVRGDAARTSDGSGLGLAIARGLTELLGGKLDLDIDGDLFKAILTLPDSSNALTEPTAQGQ
ncbi:MAG: HAMP domain-containing sensor histidine kinase [Bacillota bacterium]|nr:HAMP domain-containing sensor histidine kinase [Bacillota bacterium]